MSKPIVAECTILVTGATGFIGQVCCHEAYRRGYRVKSAMRRISDILPSGVEQLPVGEIDSNTDWEVSLQGVDTVIHLAARVHVMYEQSTDTLAEFSKVNLQGTLNLARQAATAGVKRFVYLSSIKVNGEYTTAFQPFNESEDPKPQDDYALSKWQAEQALNNISQETGMEVVVIRPPLVYGPNVKANFLKLLELVDRGVPLPLGRVQNSRSLIYVDNLVDVLITCATHPAAAGQTYLVSDGVDVSTPQLIQAVADALHCPNRIFPIPITFIRCAAKLIGKSAAVDRLTQSLVIDSSKIRNELGWKPPYTMTQGLQATAEWYLQSVKLERAR